MVTEMAASARFSPLVAVPENFEGATDLGDHGVAGGEADLGVGGPMVKLPA